MSRIINNIEFEGDNPTITDENGNIIILFNKESNSQNFFTISNSATGSEPTIGEE